METERPKSRHESAEKRVKGIITDDRPMPHDLDVEKAVIAGMLMDPKPCIDLAVERFGLDPVFYHQGHAKIYKCIFELYNSDPENIDVITVASKLAKEGVLESVGGEVYLTEIEDTIATSANFEAWCKIVDDYAMLRRMIKTCHEALDKCYNPANEVAGIVNEVEGSILKVREQKVESSISRFNCAKTTIGTPSSLAMALIV